MATGNAAAIFAPIRCCVHIGQWQMKLCKTVKIKALPPCSATVVACHPGMLTRAIQSSFALQAHLSNAHVKQPPPCAETLLVAVSGTGVDAVDAEAPSTPAATPPEAPAPVLPLFMVKPLRVSVRLAVRRLLEVWRKDLALCWACCFACCSMLLALASCSTTDAASATYFKSCGTPDYDMVVQIFLLVQLYISRLQQNLLHMQCHFVV